MPDRAPQTRAALPATALIMLGCGLLMFAFIASTVAVLHTPGARSLPVAVMGSSPRSTQLAKDIARAAPTLDVRTYASTEDVRHALQDKVIYAAVVPAASGTDDLLYVASAADPSLSSDGSAQLRGAEQRLGRSVELIDIAPLPASDPGGRATSLLIVGWLVGGYLLATVLGLRRGLRPLRTRDALLRVGALCLYAAAGGAGSIAYLDQVQHLIGGQELQLMGLGALVIAAAALSTSAVMSVFGMLGNGVALFAYAVLGTVAASPLLPAVWHTVAGYLPQTAGSDALRSTLYFESASLIRPVTVIGAYAVAGVVVLLLSAAVGSRLRRRRMGWIDDSVAMAIAAETAAGPAADRLSLWDWQGNSLILPADGESWRTPAEPGSWADDSQKVGGHADH